VPALADLEDERVEEDDQVDVIERPLLPLPDVLDQGVGYPTDQVTTDLPPYRSARCRSMSRVESPRVEGEDLVVEALEAPLPLPHQPRLEASLAVARRLDLDRPCSVASVFPVEPLRVLPTPPGGSRCGS